MTHDELVEQVAEVLRNTSCTCERTDDGFGLCTYCDAAAALSAAGLALAKALRGLDPVDAALAGQHAWRDAAREVLSLTQPHGDEKGEGE